MRKTAKNEKTSAKVGIIASEILKDPKTSKKAKSAAGSALRDRLPSLEELKENITANK